MPLVLLYRRRNTVGLAATTGCKLALLVDRDALRKPLALAHVDFKEAIYQQVVLP